MRRPRPVPRPRRLVLIVGLLAAGVAAALMAATPMQPTNREDGGSLRAVVARGEPTPGYWTLPVPPQGPPPRAHSGLEASLEPEACGACHAAQLAGWKGSLHARAMSPGLRGQLVDMLEQDPASGLECLTCHAPLDEQRPLTAGSDGSFTTNPRFREPLQRAGVTCAGCHVRQHRRFGPPALPDNPNTRYSPGTPAHGGVTRHAAFDRAEFCAVCHQFDASAAVNGKPLQNTYAEWRESDWARRGVPCQGCHMPGRQHLWKGIHDPDMVRQALAAELSVSPPGSGREPLRARLRLTNRGAGHHLPTYVTPTIVLRLVQLDGAERPLPATAREARLRRDVAFEEGSWVERSDTRLPAGGSTVLSYERPPHPRARALRATVEVLPDEFYVREVYPPLLLPGGASEGARPLVERALAEGRASAFTVWSETARLGRRP